MRECATGKIPYVDMVLLRRAGRRATDLKLQGEVVCAAAAGDAVAVQGPLIQSWCRCTRGWCACCLCRDRNSKTGGNAQLDNHSHGSEHEAQMQTTSKVRFVAIASRRREC